MKIVSPTVLLFALALTAGAVAAPVKPFEMRLVIDCAAGAKPIAYRHQASQEDLCLAPGVILSRADIKAAELVHTGYGTEAARIFITGEAVDRLAAATTANTGKRFAFVYDGRIVTAPVVMEPITGNQLEIDEGSSGDSIEDMVTDLGSGRIP